METVKVSARRTMGSAADYTALNQLGQENSILLEHGQEITFGVDDPTYLKLFGSGG